MSESPPTAPAPPVRRRKRRWLRYLAGSLLALLLLLWFVKVPLLNWSLRYLPGDYDISVTRIWPGFSGVTLQGVRVVHRPTGRQLAWVPEAEVQGSWGAMTGGTFRRLILTRPEVAWRWEFETVTPYPLEPGPPATPLIQWDHGEIHDGVFSWYERGKETPRLSAKVSRLTGGHLAIFNDGTVEAAPQAAVLDEVISREYVLGDTLEIESRSRRVEGVISAEQAANRYTVNALKLAMPQLTMVWYREAPASPGFPEPELPPPPAWYRPAEFVIKDGVAEPAKVLFTIHSPGAAPVEFSGTLARLHAAGLRAGGVHPFVIAAADGRFEGMRSLAAGARAQEIAFAGSWDEQGRVHLHSAAVKDGAVTDSGRLLAALGLSPEQTAARPVFRTGFDVKGTNLIIDGANPVSGEPQQVVLRDFSAQMPGEKEPVLKAERMEVTALPGEVLKDKRLRSVNVQKPEVRIQGSQLPPGLNPLNKSPSPPVPVPVSGKPEWFGWKADTLTMQDGTFKAVDFGPGVPNTVGRFTAATVPGPENGGPFYRVRVDNIAFENPFLAVLPVKTNGTLEMDIHPVRLWENEEIEEVRVNGHRVELNEAFLKLFETEETKKEETPAPEAPAPPAPAPESVPVPPPDTPLEEKPSPPGSPVPPVPGPAPLPPPVPAPGNPAPPLPAPADATTGWVPKWKIRRLRIDDSEVGIDDIGAGKRLGIPIRGQLFENVPLSEALLDHNTANVIQKVEVPAIYLYAPYQEGQTVIELPVNFIYFSFAGLANKRLERVELLFPKIKAGRPLFDFKDVVERRFEELKEQAHADQPKKDVAAAAAAPFSLPRFREMLAAALLQQVNAGVPAPPPAVPAKDEAPAVWDIPFFTEHGEIITAPNGLEWKQIPRLPFRNARIREGPMKGQPMPFRLYGDDVHGELAIKSQWYEFKEYNLRVWMSDEGRVVFNFPLKDRDNNLVEVFRNNTVVYKHVWIEKVWLSVTYDMQGIYVGFGGETCGGYVTGKVNLYLDQLYSWDASASLTNIDMTPLTGKLTQEYVLLQGKVDLLNVTAYGDMNGLYQTTASLRMSGPGRLQLKCLDELRRKFTDKREDWTDDFGRIGVDILRDFPFTSCEGTARLFGQEGDVRLTFTSPKGSRDFTINLHDYRNRPEKSLIRF